ncbi:MAG: hydroxypyruvate reductase [Gammaproteobacteria bacterium]|nr:MAG: hydroxypyruvate reductase [Gammaproteobacteria bacterium]TND07389.1 MAG: hydroxypyruvate reductase [Gammaproteobacteria bacterium]
MHGRDCVRAALLDIAFDSPVLVVAIGKAASAMTLGALDVLGGQIERGLVVTKHGYVEPPVSSHQRLTIIEAGHPIPDEHSLEAGARLVEFIAGAPADATLLFLVSGGASALVELLPRGIGLADLARANQWLQGAGLPIDAINRVRKRLSCIKGGRLARHLGGRRTLNLLISDVPGDVVGDIGSGLLVADAADDRLLPAHLPPWLARLMSAAAPVPDGAGPEFAGVATQIVASAALARRAAANAACRLGYDVTAHEGLVTGDAAIEGRRLAKFAMAAGPGIHVWSGETTVMLPDRPGRGGRNQHLALAVAGEMAGRADLLFLAGATDGGDGPGRDAGAIIDGDTIMRGERAGLNSGESLKAADSGRFLDAAGDLVGTGPTGTNVMDLLVALRIRA